MIYFLVSLKCLINSIFERGNIPYNTRHGWCLNKHALRPSNSRGCCLVLLRIWQLPEAIIFERVPYNFDITVPHIEIVTSVRRQIWSDLDRIFVNSKHQILLSYFVCDFDYGIVFKKHAWELSWLILWLLNWSLGYLLRFYLVFLRISIFFFFFRTFMVWLAVCDMGGVDERWKHLSWAAQWWKFRRLSNFLDFAQFNWVCIIVIVN